MVFICEFMKRQMEFVTYLSMKAFLLKSDIRQLEISFRFNANISQLLQAVNQCFSKKITGYAGYFFCSFNQPKYN